MKELNHLEERGEEQPESSELAIDRLIELFDHTDFGELTLTSACGLMEYFTPEYLLHMGRKVKL